MSSRSSSFDHIGWAALVVGSLVICFSGSIVRMTDVPALASAAWRMSFAVPALAMWAGTARVMTGGADTPAQAAAKPLSLGMIVLLVLVSGAAFAGDVSTFHLALTTTTVANAMFIAGVSPIFVVIGGYFIFGEQVRREVWIALGVALVGAWVMSGFATPASFSRGDLMAVFAALFFTAYVLAIKRLRDSWSGATATLASAAVSAVIVWGLVLAQGISYMPMSTGGWLAVIALGVVGHAGGQGLTSVALGRLPVGPIAIVMIAQSPVTALIAYLVLGEAMNTHQLAGGALIVAALAIGRPR